MVSVQDHPWNIRHKAVLKTPNIIHILDCGFCKQHMRKTYNKLHLFVRCAVVNNFWDDVNFFSVILVAYLWC